MANARLWCLSLFAYLSVYSINIQLRQNSVSLASLLSLRSFAFEEPNSQIPALSASPFPNIFTFQGRKSPTSEAEDNAGKFEAWGDESGAGYKDPGCAKERGWQVCCKIVKTFRWMYFVKMLLSGGYFKIFGQNPDRSHVGICKAYSTFKIRILKSVEVWRNLESKKEICKDFD